MVFMFINQSEKYQNRCLIMCENRWYEHFKVSVRLHQVNIFSLVLYIPSTTKFISIKVLSFVSKREEKIEYLLSSRWCEGVVFLPRFYIRVGYYRVGGEVRRHFTVSPDLYKD